jgi:epoxyqueuosine reductase
MDFVSKLNHWATELQFSHWGTAPLAKPLSLSFYREWLEAGHHASMEYLKRHLPLKEDPTQLSARATSAIVVAKSYFPHPYPAKTLSGRTALYADGRDYHLDFLAELRQLADKLKVEFPNEEFLCFTDSAPILERDLAARAGLGWVGKNTCLIHPKKGSLFFIGEILTSLALNEPAAQIADFCGTCDRCIRACPTQALIRPRVLDANLCIAYWNIESKEVAPEPLRAALGDWFFGCDICQTVCPWNEKAFGKELMRGLSQPVAAPNAALVADLRWLLSSSNKALSKAFAQLPYSRARAMGLKRNALYVSGNLQLTELRSEITRLLENPQLGALARWALDQMGETLSNAPPTID